jgi:hypothetical protein
MAIFAPIFVDSFLDWLAKGLSTTVGVKDFGGSRGLQAPENRSKGNGL